MDTQESVIVIIKDKNLILLQKNNKWHDLSFVGGKSEKEDGQLPINTAYREVEEELNLTRLKDFELKELAPKVIEFEKQSARTGTYRFYKIYPFFLKFKHRNIKALQEPENIWVNLEAIEKSDYNTEIPLSDIVKRVLPELDLTQLESFE